MDGFVNRDAPVINIAESCAPVVLNRALPVLHTFKQGHVPVSLRDFPMNGLIYSA